MGVRASIIDEARTWVGTPFRHQGRRKHVGVDCAGLIVSIGEMFGFEVPLQRDYGRLPIASKLKPILEQYFRTIPRADILPADFFYARDFDVGGAPRHFGFFTDEGTIIHADSKRGRCLEERVRAEHWQKMVSFHRFRGLI